jgi:hypothetical protein
MATPYDSAIKSEGILRYLLAQLAAEDAAQRSGLRSGIGALIGDYGAVPGGYQDTYGILSPEVRALAANNPFSTLKQLDRQRGQQRGNLKQQLAARGAIQSGEYALGENDIGYQYGLQNYNALRDLMSQIAQAEGGYASGARDRLTQQGQLYQDAVGRLREAGISPTPAVAGTDRGLGVYRDPNGALTYKAPPRRPRLAAIGRATRRVVRPKSYATMTPNGFGGGY